MCLYCNQSTGGQHEYGCSCYEPPLWRVYDTGIGEDRSDPGSYHVYPKGWVCPKCGAVWAPGVRQCAYCTPIGVTLVTTG